MRALKAKDIKTLSKMLGKVGDDNLKELIRLVQAKEDVSEVGVKIFKIISSDLTDDLYAWLADLAEMTPEELDDQPFSTPVKILTDLLKTEGIGDFFTQAATE